MSTRTPACPRCAAELAPGTLYCVLCGTRTGYRATLDPALAGGSDGTSMAQLEVRDAAASKRLLAKLVDVLPASVISGLAAAIGAATIETQPVSAVSQQITLTGLLVSMGVGSLLSLAYSVFVWGWEARTGKTPGNLLMGIRTTDEAGHAPGWLAVFVRGLIIAVGGLVPVIGTVLVLVSNVFDADGKKQGWHDKAAHTRVFDVRAGRDPLVTGGLGGPASFAPPEPPPGLQPVASPVPGSSRNAPAPRTAAGPSVAAGSTAGGVPAASSGAPRPDTSARSPFPSDGVEDATSRPSREHAAFGAANVPGSTGRNAPEAGLPGPVAPPPPRKEGRDAPSAPAVISFAPSSASAPAPAPALPTPAPTASVPAAQPAAAHAHPDDDVEQTRVTSGRAAVPCRILFDNGREVELRSQALIGRNPAGQNGEMIDQLIDFSDQGRSVSKTHLHVRVEARSQGLWVTDRNSTNGSAITSPDGQRTPVRGGETLLAQPGSTVHFGDRSFLVVRP